MNKEAIQIYDLIVTMRGRLSTKDLLRILHEINNQLISKNFMNENGG